MIHFMAKSIFQGGIMSAKIISRKESLLKIEIEIDLQGSMLDMEAEIREKLNEAGRIATTEAMKSFDTDGTPIIVSGTKLTARKQKASQHYETPYGRIHLERFLYQSNEGGYTYCPLEYEARVFLTSTPRFAKIVSESYALLSAGEVARILESHHHRKITPAYVVKLADAVASVALLKEEKWEYDIPKFDEPVAAIGMSVDGTCVKLAEGGWREAMCGTISLYNKKGERLHTAYIAASPEHGKETFHARMSRAIERTIKRFPLARKTGLGDGAPDNWTYLSQYTKNLVLDFRHVSEYVHKASEAYWGTSQKWAEQKVEWEDHWFHLLKHESGGASLLVDELKERKKELSGKKAETVQKTIGYLSNHMEMMDYAREVRNKAPIGSGVVEAACRMLVKDRMKIAGSGWSLPGAEVVLTLRSLYKSDGHWDTFWKRISRYGVPEYRTFGPPEEIDVTEHSLH